MDRQADLERLLLTRRVEEFLFHEAALLDDWQLRPWLALLSDDIQYLVPMQRNVAFGEQARGETQSGSDINWFDEGIATLRQRVEQILTGVHWAEEPLSRTTRIVGNVVLGEPRAGSGLPVSSRLLLYRNRGDEETDLFAAIRQDELTERDGTFRISRRKVLLQQNVLLAKNLTLFF